MTGWKERGGPSLARAVEAAYARGEDDYHMPALVALSDAGQPVGKLRDGDTVVFCCRRGEQEIELTEMFTEKGFSAVERTWRSDLTFILMTLYHEKFAHLPGAFAPEQLHNTLAQAVSEAGKTQFHCAESEKFAHTTFFLNGGNNTPFPGETDLRIPSPKGIAFEDKPDLSLYEVAEATVNALGKYDLIAVNFANGDVIGHTANSQAKIAAAGHVSRVVSDVAVQAAAAGYTVLITADHGNLERMTTPKGKPDVAHTCNPVPCVLITLENAPLTLREDCCLASVSPTLLHAHGLHVGLGAKKAGNSEAGHMNLGASRIVPQDDQRLEKAIQDGSYEQNKVFLSAIEDARKSGKALHLLSYLTHNSSHGSIDYAVKLCAMAKDLPEVYLHIILDGRSTENGSAPQLLLELEEKLQAIGAGVIVDCIGRGNVLDRDFNYAKVKIGYDAMVDGVGETYLLSL